MARLPALWALVTVLAIYGGLEGATAVPTATDSSPSITADSPSTTNDFSSTTAVSLSSTGGPFSTTANSLSNSADSLSISDRFSSSTDGSISVSTDSPSSTADSPSSTADFPSSTADSPSSTADSPSSTADSPSSTGDSPSSTADSPSFTADSPSSTADSPSSTGDSPSSTADSPSSTADSPSSTADSASSTADSPSSTADSPSSTPDSPSSTADSSSSTDNPLSSTGDYPSSTGDSPSSTENQPKITFEMEPGGRQLRVSWTDLNCTEGYEMDGNCSRNYSCCSNQCEPPPNMVVQENFRIIPVDPCTTYTVRVKGKNCSSTWSEKSHSINCTEPTKPRNLHVTNPPFNTSKNESRTATITWDNPLPTNGNLSHYLLNYNNTGIEHIGSRTISKDECKSESDGSGGHKCEYPLQLKPESYYTFRVQAVNKESPDPSPEDSYDLKTKAGKPFFTNSNPPLFCQKVTHNSITLRINGSSFSNANGNIRKCYVKMKKCDEKPEDFNSVYCIEKPPNSEFTVVIGGEKRTRSACPNYETTSTLDPKECYNFLVYIYADPLFTKSEPIKITTKQDPLMPVLYGLLGVLIILLLLVAAAIGIFRYRYRPIRHSESIDLPLVVPSPPDVSVERRILLSDLLATVQRLFSNGSEGLTTEYAQIQALSTSKPCRNAQLQANRVKTRYLNILPYDETRVVLKEYPHVIGSDFINASYIHGYSMAREFIACQGPLANTVGDFWRMVWEKNVHVIVMVTQCIERNREKCSKYWPDTGKSFYFGDLTLKVRHLQEQEHQEDGFIQRTLQLSKIHKVRPVHHFHFVSWPDMGCPETPDKLIKFVKVVKDAVPTESAHVVVHCSAGVGRTGTFIGLSNLIEEMHEQDSIDVFHTVYRMRLHRTNMVQTKVQYAFLYKCVLKYYLDQKGESESWSAIEKRLDNPEAIPDVINGTLQGAQHDQSDEGDVADSISKENTSKENASKQNVSQEEKGSQHDENGVKCAEIIQIADEQ